MSHAQGRDEFYVGYHPVAPPGIGQAVRLAAGALVLLGAVLAPILSLSQGRFPVAKFEFGEVRSFEGRIHESPYPELVVAREGVVGDQPSSSYYQLSAPGKHGAGLEVSGLEGQAVRLEGSLIYRDDQTMVQLVPGSIDPRRTVLPARPPTVQDLGLMTLVGEIVDSKCFLGVMNPGELKTHRACAARCISGGVPPMLVVRDSSGVARYFLLVSREGHPVNRAVWSMAAEQVEITGRVLRTDDLLTLYADPETYRRLQ